MRLSRWVLSVAAMTAVGLALVGGSSARPDSSIKVGLIVKTTTNPYFADMIKGAKAQAAKLHVTLLVASGKFDGDTGGQVTAIENMVSAGVKGIMITASGDAVVPALEKARKAGVYTIALDSPTNPTSAVDALFATNNYNAGKLIGQYAKTGKKATGYTDTGVTLITAKSLAGVPSKGLAFGLANCWG